MNEQDRRARADWVQFEAAGRDLEKRAEALGLSRDDLQAQLEPLALASERGILEYKHGAAGTAFRELDQARYRSLAAGEITEVARRFGVLVFVAGVQRMMCDGVIVLKERKTQDAAPVEPDREIDVKAIIAEIEERAKADPEFRTRQPVKNILTSLSRYSRELEEFKEVTARTPPERRGQIAANFRRTSEEIFAGIRKQYEQLQAEERAAVPSEPQNILLRLPIREFSPFVLRQAKEASEVRSHLLFARDEQQGTRELLVSTADRQDRFLGLIRDEEAKYLEIGGTDRVTRAIARAFAVEIGRRLAREAEYY